MFTRAEWSALGGSPPSQETDEVSAIYRPLCLLLAAAASGSRAVAGRLAAFLEPDAVPAPSSSPFVIGITGSVGVGKSTFAQAVGRELTRTSGLAPVEVLSTDSFLYSNDELAARGLTERKGFPESYDWQGLLAALGALRAGAEEVEVPVYSHRHYDIIPGSRRTIARPAVLVVEGLNVLQASSDGTGPLMSDFIDWSIYVDAAVGDIANWHCERLLALRTGTGSHEGGFLGWFGSLSEAQAEEVARASWTEINAVNLRDHIDPSRPRARTILYKAEDHRVTHVLVRTR